MCLGARQLLIPLCQQEAVHKRTDSLQMRVRDWASFTAWLTDLMNYRHDLELPHLFDMSNGSDQRSDEMATGLPLGLRLRLVLRAAS